MSCLDEMPVLGSGLGYRPELAEGIELHAAELDVLEIITERYIGRRRAELEAICQRWPVVPHGVSLSIGSLGPVDREHLRRLQTVIEVTKAPYYSEHLCFTRVPGLDLGHLAPLHFTTAVLRRTIDRVNEVQDGLGMPLVLENVTYLFEVPGSTLAQTEFFSRIVDGTGCGVLLDVTNLYINSVNHGFDPLDFLAQMPLDRVVHLHLAGGYWDRGVMIDSHSHPVPDEVWRLLNAVAARAPIKTIILEHDSHFPTTIDPLIAQVRRARVAVAEQKGFSGDEGRDPAW